MEDLKDVQSVQNFKAGTPAAINAKSNGAPMRALTSGTSSLSKVLSLPPAPGSPPLTAASPNAPRSGGFDTIRSRDGSEVLVPLGNSAVDVSRGAPSADALRDAYVSQQDSDDDPEYGGFTPKDVRDVLVSVSVQHAMDAITVLNEINVPSTSGTSVATAESLAQKISPTEALGRAERSRDTRSRADLARMSGEDREDMQGVQSPSSSLRQALRRDITSMYPRIRNRDAGGKRNNLRGGVATRGDVGATRSSTIVLRADSQVASTASAMKARARGQNVLVQIAPGDETFDLLITSDNPNAIINLRTGVGFGDRIR